DVTPVRAGTHGIEALPGNPVLRLWEDSADMLDARARTTPVSPGWDKLGLDARTAGLKHATEALPVDTVYLFAPRSESHSVPSAVEMLPRDAMVGLLSNTLAAQLPRRPEGADLELIARIVRTCRVCQLTTSTDFSRVNVLCEWIAEDLARSSNTTEGTYPWMRNRKRSCSNSGGHTGSQRL